MPQRVHLPDGRIVNFPDGMSPDDIQKAMGEIGGSGQAEQPAAPKMTFNDLASKGPSAIPVEQRGSGAKTVNPVTTGAMAAGALAAPFTAGMSIPATMAATGVAAGGGAAAGNLLKQATDNKPFSVSDTLRDVAIQGGLQSAGSGVGAGLARVLGWAAPKVIRGIMRPSRRLQDEFGADELVETALKERIPIGAHGSAAQAGARKSASAAKADTVIAKAEQAGAPPVKTREIVGQLRPVADKVQLRARGGRVDDTPEVAQRARDLKRQNPNGITLADAQRLKREMQEMADGTFRAIEKGNPVKDTTALADKAVAQGLRGGIEARVPEVRGINQQTQKLYGLEQALEDAEARNVGIVGIGNLIGSFAPQLGSRGAYAADAASRSGALPTGGQLLGALIAALTGDGSQRP